MFSIIGSKNSVQLDAACEEDSAIVERAAAGDPTALRTLYDRYRPVVFRVADGFAQLDHNDRDDVVQETFVRAFKSLCKLKDPARLRPWLLAIARNRALTHLARRRGAQVLAEELEKELNLVEHPGPEFLSGANAGVDAELELVRRIIAAQPEGPEKETVYLFYVEGEMSAREIAQKQGVSKSAITMRLERFRAKVKKELLAEVAKLRGEES